jgi:hypothetical protein
MAMDISTYLPGLSLKFFFQLIYTDSVYLEKKNHIKILAQKIELKLSLVGPLSKVCVHPPSTLLPRWLPLLYVDISLKTRIG